MRVKIKVCHLNVTRKKKALHCFKWSFAFNQKIQKDPESKYAIKYACPFTNCIKTNRYILACIQYPKMTKSKQIFVFNINYNGKLENKQFEADFHFCYQSYSLLVCLLYLNFCNHCHLDEKL